MKTQEIKYSPPYGVTTNVLKAYLMHEDFTWKIGIENQFSYNTETGNWIIDLNISSSKRA